MGYKIEKTRNQNLIRQWWRVFSFDKDRSDRVTSGL